MDKYLSIITNFGCHYNCPYCIVKNNNLKIEDIEHIHVEDSTLNVNVSGGTIRKLAEAATIKRGTILAKSSGTSGDGKLVVLGTAATGDEVLTANCILCDDVEVGTSDDVTVPVYLTGCFNTNKCIVADSYTMTEADKDALREGGIFFKAAAPAL